MMQRANPLNLIGHNKPSFDDVVEENLRRGLLLMQRDTLIRCIEDPRLQPRHRMVLAKIIKRTNQKTGMAYPGRRTIAQDTGVMAGGVADPSGPYSEQVIANTISELIAFEYLVRDQRAPEGGKRALSHYALAAPSIEDVELEVQSYLQAIEAKAPRLRPDVTIRSDVRISDVTQRGDVTTKGDASNHAIVISEKIPDVTTVSDVTTDVGTVTSSKREEKERDSVVVNCNSIQGPNFNLDLAAVDLTAQLIGMSTQEARTVAEICARDWVANDIKPQRPMAMVKAALMSHHNQGQIQSVRLDKAKGPRAPAEAESRAERITRFVKEAEEKNRRHQP